MEFWMSTRVGGYEFGQIWARGRGGQKKGKSVDVIYQQPLSVGDRKTAEKEETTAGKRKCRFIREKISFNWIEGGRRQ